MDIFTSYFNEVAEIASDYKIYAKGTENLADYITNSDFTFFTSIDMAKSVGNAYKVFSQLINESQLNFSINNIVLGFEYDKKSLEVINIY